MFYVGVFGSTPPQHLGMRLRRLVPQAAALVIPKLGFKSLRSFHFKICIYMKVSGICFSATGIDYYIRLYDIMGYVSNPLRKEWLNVRIRYLDVPCPFGGRIQKDWMIGSFGCAKPNHKPSITTTCFLLEIGGLNMSASISHPQLGGSFGFV